MQSIETMSNWYCAVKWGCRCWVSPSEGGDVIFGVISWQDSGDDDDDELEGTTWGVGDR